MPTYPNTPLPSSVSPPAIIDPCWEFVTDSGVSIRRVKHSRPLRRWTLEYLGKSTAAMRAIRGFLLSVRLGTVDFAWAHPTAIDMASVYPTTPVTVQYAPQTGVGTPTASPHGMFTGQWLGMSNSSIPTINGGVFAVTVIDELTLTLQGSVGSGIAGVATVVTYVPRARAMMQEEGTFPSPAILVGPEQTLWPGYRTGMFNFSVVLEEIF